MGSHLETYPAPPREATAAGVDSAPRDEERQQSLGRRRLEFVPLPVIVDATGAVVGPVVSGVGRDFSVSPTTTAFFQPDVPGVPIFVLLFVDEDQPLGQVGTAEIYFESNDCTGTPWIDAGSEWAVQWVNGQRGGMNTIWLR